MNCEVDTSLDKQVTEQTTNNNMRWSEPSLPENESPPTIKNHSVTYHRGYLYCFGGYDGRRNHQTLLIYSLREQRWLSVASAPAAGNAANTAGGVLGGLNRVGGVGGVNGANNNRRGASQFVVTGGSCPPGRNGHTATLATCRSSRQRRRLIESSITSDAASVAVVRSVFATLPTHDQRAQMQVSELVEAMVTGLKAAEINGLHVASISNVENKGRSGNDSGNDNLQGGDANDDNRNPNQADEMEEDGTMNDDDDDEDAQIIIIGGWLGSGPYAASDVWVLDISGGLERLRWFQPPVRGTPPGPCNMHSADFIQSKNEVYVFRGGNGREYLNDLHALDVDTYVWRAVETHGDAPQQRANHSSAVLDWNGTTELFIFGGWNGTERLNDIHILDTTTSTWSTPRISGVKPHPRAGMTLTALRGRLFLFGGSGTSSKCFDDLQILDRKEMAWLDVNDEDAVKLTAHDNESNELRPWASDLSRQDADGMVTYDNDTTTDDTKHRIHQFATDWRSQERQHAGSAAAYSSVNPNDEDMIPSVFVTGKPPGKRTGHTATAVGRNIFVFGGSCGSDYLNDFFVLDTDPPPLVKITEPTSLQLYARRLRHFYDDAEFSDVTFLVEGRRIFGHRLVLSLVSDCFRAMFMTGFRESTSVCAEIDMPDCKYDIFAAMMKYIYTGQEPEIDVFSTEPGQGIDQVISLLELADQFFLYHLKEVCERLLQPAVNSETFSYLLQVAQKTNSSQLESYCRYFERNMNEI